MKKFFITLVILILLLAASVAVALSLLDVNAYRGRIADALSEQTGRAVKLNGPLKLMLTSKGLVLEIQDASIGNPDWASRPDMADIGRFKLSIALVPLLKHRLAITALEIDNADILLESTAVRHNWDFSETGVVIPRKPAMHPLAHAEPGPSIAVGVNRLSIKNSLIALRSGGKTLAFKTDDMELGPDDSGMTLDFAGEYNATPLNLTLKSNADDLTSKKERPLDVALDYSGMQLKASGILDSGAEKIGLSSYELTSGNSSLHGQLEVNWSQAQPFLQGTLISDHASPADFKMPDGDAASNTSAPAAPAQAAPERVFSDAPLGLDGLKAVNADFDMTIGELALGSVTLTDVSGKIAVANGKLTIMPFKAALGSGALEGQMALDGGAVPPRLTATFTANSVDLSDLMKLGGIEAFLSGKVNGDLNIVATGTSAHELASNTSGSVNVIGAGGDVVSSASDKLSSGLTNLFAPGSDGGNTSMNCVVARFTALNGVVRDNGILVDTDATTVAGSGGFDLRSETIDLAFYARPKGVDTGGLLPPLEVGGTFSCPTYSVSAAQVLQNVTGMLRSQLTGQTLDAGVPNITEQQGQNACLYTLEHPRVAAAAAPSQGGAVQKAISKYGNKLKSMLGQ